MEKKSYIFSELGIILLGFSIYESIFSPANITENFISGFPKGFMVFSKPEFTAERASFVVAYVFVIVLLIFDMHRYQYESIPERRRIGLIALACMLFIFLAPYWLIGFRVAFCACLGVALLELGMWIDTDNRKQKVQSPDHVE